MAAKPVQPDITLVLDLEGVIRDATLSPAMAAENVDGWLGQAWTDVVGADGSDKVRRIVADTRASGISAFRQINQRFPSGAEIPMEFTTMMLGDRSGILAVGKNLQAVTELHARLIAAQQAMERDYWRFRELETRYRLVFEASTDAVLIVSAVDLRIIEANRAAVQALSGVDRVNEDLNGREFFQEIAPADRDSVRDMLLRVRERGMALSILVHTARKGRPWMLRCSMMSSPQGQVFLLQFAPVASSADSEDAEEQASLRELIDRVPDGFVALDSAGIIRQANQAFLDIVELGSKGSVVGESLGRWLNQPGADLGALLGHLRRYKTVRLFHTVVRGELGSETEVEISAVDGEDRGYTGVLLRNVSRRLGASSEGDALRDALGQISKQLGRSSLRKLVKNAVTIVEKHYVREALEISKGNRTATAELLGLSRQSLYAKLSRYGLDDKGPGPQDGDPED